MGNQMPGGYGMNPVKQFNNGCTVSCMAMTLITAALTEHVLTAMCKSMFGWCQAKKCKTFYWVTT
jgi:hypothetical protein